ncbi:MAG TPA: SsrA-binding protein SmpB [Bacteroidota bacterium]|nr:SsrA-binding protein SmpB [Bacteroidota bacterium]
MRSNSTESEQKTVVSNRKARHDYEVLDSYETGIVLKGSEVKSLRLANANLQDSYAMIRGGEVWLEGMHINTYEQANQFNHEPVRARRLLLHKKEIRKLFSKTNERGLTLVPLKVYFSNGKAKVELGLCKGKKSYDKRETLAKRDHDIEMQRERRARG